MNSSVPCALNLAMTCNLFRWEFEATTAAIIIIAIAAQASS